MTYPTFPKNMPLAVTSSKRIQSQQGWATYQPMSGPTFYTQVTDDIAVTFDVELQFKADAALAFDDWILLNGFNRSGGWFYFDIDYPEGLVTQEVMLIDNGIQRTGQNGKVYSYSMSFKARKENRPQLEVPGMNLAMYENNPCVSIEKAANLLDIAINVSWPEA